ncbi:hypothetical protein COOONC_18672 [Cooperia oncophora]
MTQNVTNDTTAFETSTSISSNLSTLLPMEIDGNRSSHQPSAPPFTDSHDTRANASNATTWFPVSTLSGQASSKAERNISGTSTTETPTVSSDVDYSWSEDTETTEAFSIFTATIIPSTKPTTIHSTPSSVDTTYTATAPTITTVLNMTETAVATNQTSNITSTDLDSGSNVTHSTGEDVTETADVNTTVQVLPHESSSKHLNTTLQLTEPTTGPLSSTTSVKPPTLSDVVPPIVRKETTTSTTVRQSFTTETTSTAAKPTEGTTSSVSPESTTETAGYFESTTGYLSTLSSEG